MTGTYLEPQLWYATLPTVYVSACVLITDADGRVLIVKPNYRDYWAIPGGIIEDGEPPQDCAARELREELGYDVEVGDLLVVDWAPPLGERPRPMLNFIFDGGTLADSGRIRLQVNELETFGFFPRDEAANRLPENTAPRVAAALRGRKDHRTVYLPTDGA